MARVARPLCSRRFDRDFNPGSGRRRRPLGHVLVDPAPIASQCVAVGKTGTQTTRRIACAHPRMPSGPRAGGDSSDAERSRREARHALLHPPDPPPAALGDCSLLDGPIAWRHEPTEHVAAESAPNPNPAAARSQTQRPSGRRSAATLINGAFALAGAAGWVARGAVMAGAGVATMAESATGHFHLAQSVEGSHQKGGKNG